MKDWQAYVIVAPIALIIGAIIGGFIVRYILKKQIEEWKKKIETPDREQIRNMLTALGQKPSEEQINRFIRMTQNQCKKETQNPKKAAVKKKK
ncbi:conserved protein of unknown function (UPF0154 domain) [endosymbiont DhMRE of Dentiscutata heterogama]|uniref:YneF family protein n=1 Tax=endosymbiont DhMRE of Dentiscutata heterogama TaxID=1609546 RepID=UPI000629D6DE|nr:YneF family protein [endosymbiont DhMRE of Dentiscutata heterogama]CFW93143.1 conserved protein of unknown function (UPF0154 domain) [endosymbiont DhMRE of Dentiscutata heterogama]